MKYKVGDKIRIIRATSGCYDAEGRGCEPSRCDFLKHIPDYVLEECIAENITKRAPLTDVGNDRRSNKKEEGREL